MGLGLAYHARSDLNVFRIETQRTPTLNERLFTLNVRKLIIKEIWVDQKYLLVIAETEITILQFNIIPAAKDSCATLESRQAQIPFQIKCLSCKHGNCATQPPWELLKTKCVNK